VTGHTHDVDDVHGLRDGLTAAQRRIGYLEQENQRLGAEFAELRAEVRADVESLRTAGAKP
jgi:ATP-dependent helicase YprA (DUF1998 family)